MAISYVGSAIGVNSATLPAHIADDIIIGFSFRDGSTTPPTIPGSWTNILNPTGSNSCSASCAYIIASGSGTSSGTWTNATNTCFVVYRGIRTFNPIGAKQSAVGSGILLTVPALTLNYQDNTSWILNFNGVRATLINLQIPPLGFVTRISDSRLQANDTDGPISTFSGVNLGLGITLTGWEAMSIELLDNCGPVNSPTPTPTISVTPTFTPTNTMTATVTQTVTSTQTSTITPTATVTSTMTVTPTNTLTPSTTVTFTPTETCTPTVTASSTITPTPTETLTPTPTVTSTPTVTPTITCSLTISSTKTVTPTVTGTPGISQTPIPTQTPSATFGITVTQSRTTTPTMTVTATLSVTRTPTVTPTWTPSVTPTPEGQ